MLRLMGVWAPSLHRESTDSLIVILYIVIMPTLCRFSLLVLQPDAATSNVYLLSDSICNCAVGE